MATDPTPQSPLWWLCRLDKKLDARRKRYDKLEKYYSGNHPLPEGDERCREMFKSFQRKARTNYMRLVADSTRERLRVVGFRTGGESSSSTDTDAWRIWQANHLDADSAMVHEAALKFSDSYVMVGPGDGTTPLITGEDPRQVIAEPDPLNRRRFRAGLKTWVDDAEKVRHAVVYLPDQVHYFKVPYAEQSYGEPGWEIESAPVGNPLTEVPLVRFVNSPSLGGDGVGEFEDVIDIQDRINDTVLNRMVITKLQAYRQRYVTGIAAEDDKGNDIELPFVPGVDLLWAVEDENVKFGDFEQSDLGPILEAIREDVKAIVMLTGLPPHYVAGDIVNASADALAAAESRLVAKVRDRATAFGESWEQVLRLAFTYMGQADRFGVDAEVQWMDPERKSDAQLADAAVKKQTAGVPWRQLMADLGYTPSQIDRMEADRVTDALMSPSPVAPPAGPVPAGA